MYKDEYHPRVKRDLKKVDVRIRKEIRTTHIPAIILDPGLGQNLLGDLAGIRSYHFKIANQQYRIAYIVSEEERKVFVLMIAKREGFYSVIPTDSFMKLLVLEYRF